MRVALVQQHAVADKTDDINRGLTAMERAARSGADDIVADRLQHAILLVAAAVLLAGCAGIKSQTNSYATLSEARESGAIAKGWIPDGLPTSSHDIREGHVPGASQRWGLFEYPQAEEGILRAMMEPQEVAPDGLPCDVPARVEWWPKVLRGPLDGSRVAATGARVYRAKAGGFMFAVNWNQGRAYYWRE